MARILVVLLVVAGLAAPAAAARTILHPSDQRHPLVVAQLQAWVEQAQVRSPNRVLPVVFRACPFPHDTAGDACGTFNGHQFQVYLGPKFLALEPGFQQAVFLHELGHFYDWNTLTTRQRVWVASLYGYTPPAKIRHDKDGFVIGAWQRLGDGAWPNWWYRTKVDGVTIDERFAMLYSDCALGLAQPSGSLKDTIPAPTYERVCGLLEGS